MKKIIILVIIILLGLVCTGCKYTKFYAHFSVSGYPITYQDPQKEYELPKQYQIKSYTVLPYIKSTSSEEFNNDYTFWIEVFTEKEYDNFDSRIIIDGFKLTDKEGNVLAEDKTSNKSVWSYNYEYKTYKQKLFVINNDALKVKDNSVYFLHVQSRIDNESYNLEYKIDVRIPRGFLFQT